MDVKRLFINGDGFHVPAVMLTPASYGAAALIVPGYGGSKEEFLGLAWRVAELGFATCVIDLRGHGEHMLPLDDDVLQDVEAAVRHCRGISGKVIAIGHSMGGRLALLSSADAAIAISPAYSKTYCESTHNYIRRMESHRVREPDTETVFRVLEKLPLWQPGNGRPVSIIYGSRDNYDTIQSCRELEAAGVPVVLIEKALHGDSFLFEATFQAIKGELARVF
ncbi:MAG: Alpha/beta hydrolase family protein [Methanocella sp. PtaU1.Bin125]|nr:MAG: Alpha/beta hydrolase family protein [Methanocella sp. PtaU1.Bin125]